MDKRDKDLTHLFVRDLDEIALPPRGEWRRPQGRETIVTRTSRYLLTAGAIVAVLAIALIVGLQLNQRQQSAATPIASSTSSGVAASLPPPTGPIFNDSFGFILISGGGSPQQVIRKESRNQGNAPYPGQGLAVSPDGLRVADWEPRRSGWELVVTNLGFSTEEILVTLAADQRPGGVAWSNDGAALLYSTETGSFGVGGGTNSATLNIWELAANGRHGTTIDTQTNTGWLYRPLAWDRSANLAAVGLTGEGAFMGIYETVRINADNSFTVSRVDSASRTMTMGSVRASSDAKYVLGVGGVAGDLNWWPIDSYGALKTQAGAGTRGAQWRPGTHEIGFLSAEQFWLGDVDKAGAQGLCCTAFSGAPASSTLATFRADGTAVVLGVRAATPLGQASYTLVRIGTDPKATSGDRATFEDVDGLVASVRFR